MRILKKLPLFLIFYVLIHPAWVQADTRLFSMKVHISSEWEVVDTQIFTEDPEIIENPPIYHNGGGYYDLHGSVAISHQGLYTNGLDYRIRIISNYIDMNNGKVTLEGDCNRRGYSPLNTTPSWVVGVACTLGRGSPVKNTPKDVHIIVDRIVAPMVASRPEEGGDFPEEDLEEDSTEPTQIEIPDGYPPFEKFREVFKEIFFKGQFLMERSKLRFKNNNVQTQKNKEAFQEWKESYGVE